MHAHDQKFLADHLGRLSSNEKRLLYKRAAEIRRQRIKSWKPPTLRVIARYDEDEDDGPPARPIRQKNRGVPDLDEIVLQLLKTEFPGTPEDEGAAAANQVPQDPGEKEADAGPIPGLPETPRLPTDPSPAEGLKGAFSPQADPAHPIAMVVRISQGTCIVQHAGIQTPCRLHPDLARRQQSALTVGDRVRLEGLPPSAPQAPFPARAEAVGGRDPVLIREVLARKTWISRVDPGNCHRELFLAANVDLAVIVVAAGNPPLHPALIDRFLIALGRGGVRPLICLNKSDLVPPGPERDHLMNRLAPYRSLGHPVIVVSASSGEGLPELRRSLTDRIAVVLGHSGVGKSSLLNALAPGLEIRTNGLKRADGKGRHTTTASELHELEGGIRIIDTPGIKELGLGRLPGPAVRRYFAEFATLAARCRFNDCSHIEEPGCAVREGAAAGTVPRERYLSYCKLLGAAPASDPPAEDGSAGATGCRNPSRPAHGGEGTQAPGWDTSGEALPPEEGGAIQV